MGLYTPEYEITREGGCLYLRPGQVALRGRVAADPLGDGVAGLAGRQPVEPHVLLRRHTATAVRLREGLRYSSHTTRSGLGLARVVRPFVWPRHANSVLSTTPLDP